MQIRSVNWQRQTQARDRACDGQPENLMGKFWISGTSLKRPKILGGWAGLFASKLAPTFGLGAGSWRLVGCQAAFASKLAPTVDWVWAVGVGRLGGHHHWQASSHSWIECRQLVIGRLSGRHREQAHPLQQSKSRPQALHHSMAECQLAESS